MERGIGAWRRVLPAVVLAAGLVGGAAAPLGAAAAVGTGTELRFAVRTMGSSLASVTGAQATILARARRALRAVGVGEGPVRQRLAVAYWPEGKAAPSGASGDEPLRVVGLGRYVVPLSDPGRAEAALRAVLEAGALWAEVVGHPLDRPPWPHGAWALTAVRGAAV